MPSTSARRSPSDEYSMGGHHPHRPERRHHHSFDEAPRHVPGVVCLPRQRPAQDLSDGVTRQHHVAEALAPAVLVRNVERDAFDRRVAGHEPRELRELVRAARPAQLREVVGHLLQAQHVEIGEAARVGDDAGEVAAPVRAEAPLDVPGDELHRSACLVSEFRRA